MEDLFSRRSLVDQMNSLKGEVERDSPLHSQGSGEGPHLS